MLTYKDFARDVDHNLQREKSHRRLAIFPRRVPVVFLRYAPPLWAYGPSAQGKQKWPESIGKELLQEQASRHPISGDPRKSNGGVSILFDTCIFPFLRLIPKVMSLLNSILVKGKLMMKKVNLFVSMALVAAASGMLTGNANADFLTPASVQATSQWGGLDPNDGAIINLINSSGLSVDSIAGVHDNPGNAKTMWHAGNIDAGLGGPTGSPPVVASQAVVFDMGNLFDLTSTHIWQMNQLGFTDRGIASMTISTSSDNVTFTSIASVLPAIAGGILAGEPVQTFASVASGVRYIRFDNFTTHSGSASEYVGLSEVRFEGVAVPEPATVTLLATFGLLGFIGFGRRRKR